MVLPKEKPEEEVISFRELKPKLANLYTVLDRRISSYFALNPSSLSQDTVVSEALQLRNRIGNYIRYDNHLFIASEERVPPEEHYQDLVNSLKKCCGEIEKSLIELNRIQSGQTNLKHYGYC